MEHFNFDTYSACMVLPRWKHLVVRKEKGKVSRTKMEAHCGTKMEAYSAPRMEAHSGTKRVAHSIPQMEAHCRTKMEVHSGTNWKRIL